MDPIKQPKTFEPTRKALSLVDEFKAFAFKGNVIDLAVGVIIGAAFGKIISSLVDNIVMPLVSLLIPVDQEYTKWAVVINDKPILYGKFLADVVNFLVVALVLFVFTVKFVGWMMKLRHDEATAAPPPLSKDQELLTEIRDLLKKDQGGAR
jgi:large conductance mechanosensitive channel